MYPPVNKFQNQIKGAHQQSGENRQELKVGMTMAKLVGGLALGAAMTAILVYQSGPYYADGTGSPSVDNPSGEVSASPSALPESIQERLELKRIAGTYQPDPVDPTALSESIQERLELQRIADMLDR